MRIVLSLIVCVSMFASSIRADDKAKPEKAPKIRIKGQYAPIYLIIFLFFNEIQSPDPDHTDYSQLWDMSQTRSSCRWRIPDYA